MPNYNEIWSDKGLIFLLKLLVFASNVASKPLKEGYWVWFVDKGTLLIKLITVDHRGSRKWLPPTVLKEYRTGPDLTTTFSVLFMKISPNIVWWYSRDIWVYFLL